MISLTKLTKEILKAHNLEPKKYLSQNFLVDRGVYNKIIAAAELEKTDQIIEIGPGLGFLTNELAKAAGQIWAIEIDKGLASALRSVEAVTPNLKIINKDIMRVKLVDLPEFDIKRPYKVVANIPYHLTAKIIKKYLSDRLKPQRLVILVQKEVADRILATAGKHSLLSLSVQYYGTPRLISYVNKKSFYPAPKVDSAIIVIDIFEKDIDLKEEKKFWQLVRIGFSAKRKKLISNLSAGLGIDKKKLADIFSRIGIQSGARAQHLSLAQWLELSQLIK